MNVDPDKHLDVPWRQGRYDNSHRLVLAQLGPVPEEHDPPVGWMESAALAERIVTIHNDALRIRGRLGL